MLAKAASIAVLMIVVTGLACDDSRTRPSSRTPAPPGGGSGPGSGGSGVAAAAQSPAKAAAVAFARAVVAGDIETAKAHAVGDATGLGWLQDMADFAASDAKWQAALEAKFGEGDPAPFASTYISLAESASEEVSGDTAILTAPGARSATQMLRQKDGTWKVNLNYDPHGRAASAVEAMRSATRMNEEIAAGVSSGKYPSLPDALQARFEKIAEIQATVAPSPAAPSPTPPTPESPGTEGDGLD